MCFITPIVDVSVFAETTITGLRLEGMEAKVYIVAYADDVSDLLVCDNEEIQKNSRSHPSRTRGKETRVQCSNPAGAERAETPLICG